jgi:hypothetical protein
MQEGSLIQEGSLMEEGSPMQEGTGEHSGAMAKVLANTKQCLHNLASQQGSSKQQGNTVDYPAVTLTVPWARMRVEADHATVCIWWDITSA